MSGINRVFLLGSLGAAPELKTTSGGTPVMKIRMATSETYLDKNNVRQEKTEWHAVTLWGKRAEALAKFLHKGSTIAVEGSLHTSSYEKNGTKMYSTEINASNIVLCDKRRDGDAGQSERTGRVASKPAPADPADDFENYAGGDDIPF